MSRLALRLEHNGLVERERVPQGRRQWQLRLTPLGHRLVPILECLAKEADAAFFGCMPADDREQLARALKLAALRCRLRPVPFDWDG
jgi:DNA-binding MarR family transcriptional regulator